MIAKKSVRNEVDKEDDNYVEITFFKDNIEFVCTIIFRLITEFSQTSCRSYYLT